MESKDFENLMNEMLKEAPKDLVDVLFKIAAMRADEICSTEMARRKFREEHFGDKEMLSKFNALCERYDLNVMVVQTLGNIKAMLGEFDGNDFSFKNTHENVTLLRNVITVAMISGRNVGEQMSKIRNMEDENETGAGKTPT